MNYQILTKEELGNVLRALPSAAKSRGADLLAKAAAANVTAYRFVENKFGEPASSRDAIVAAAGGGAPNVEDAYRTLDSLESETRCLYPFAADPALDLHPGDELDFLAEDRAELEYLRLEVAEHTGSVPLLHAHHLARILQGVPVGCQGVAAGLLAVVSKANYQLVEERHPKRVVGLGAHTVPEILAAAARIPPGRRAAQPMVKTLRTVMLRSGARGLLPIILRELEDLATNIPSDPELVL